MSEPGGGKSKSALKAERRALQEAQRAAKAKGEKGPKAPTGPPAEMAPTKESNHPSPQAEWQSCDAACESLLASLDSLLRDYERPSSATFARGLEAAVNEADFARSLAPPLANLVSAFRQTLLADDSYASDAKAREELTQWLREWREEKLSEAAKAISVYAREKLASLPEPRRVLVYSASALVARILKDAAQDNLQLHVHVVEGGRGQQGLAMLEELAAAGMENLAYSPLSGLRVAMSNATVVLVEGEAFLGDGSCVAESGVGLLGLSAARRLVPLLVACPTYKFVETAGRGSLEPFGAGRELIPGSHIAGVVTELRLLPASAASTVFRVKQAAVA